MSWKSGSELMAEVVRAVQRRFPLGDDLRLALYLELIPAFERRGCDVLMDCKGIDSAYDDAYDQLNPPDREDG